MFYQKSGKVSKAAARADMDEKTARKYIESRTLPSETKVGRQWRTHSDIFADVWPEIESFLVQPGRLQAKTIFEWLQRTYPGKYQPGALRTLQRRLKQWRATSGPAKDVMFPQKHHAGRLCASDFTRMSKLNVTIGGRSFAHMLFHFVLTYSNWETATICFSESFESLSEGLQNALWKLGGVPHAHRTDQLSSAVHQELGGRQSFTDRYKGLMAHYGLAPEKIRAGQAHENGDSEKSHDLLKNAVDQELMLRGSRDFACREDYDQFLRMIIARRNSSRRERIAEDVDGLAPLPARRMESATTVRVRVRTSAAIRVMKNDYSVPSRLIGEIVEVRLGAESLSVSYAGTVIESHIPRLHGEGGHRINYRHVIESLVRKPGAFAEYQWQDDLFPTSRFRMAYDLLQTSHGSHAVKEYLLILELAAMENEMAVDEALRVLLDAARPFDSYVVAALVRANTCPQKPRDVCVDAVDLSSYDALFEYAA